MDAFDKLLKQGGIVQAPREDDDPLAAFASGSVENGTAKIQYNFDPNPYTKRKFFHPAMPYIGTRTMLGTLIHELIHLVAKGGGDNEMARRVYEGGDSKNKPLNPLDFDPRTGKSKDGSGKDFAFEASRAWKNALELACVVPDAEFKVWWKTGGP